MSICGKYDLYDHLCMERTYPPDPQNPRSPYTCDIMECFEVFKKKTGGVIYQHVRVEVNWLNQFLIEQMCPEFKVLTHTRISADRRYKEGKRETVYYTYQFRGEEYTTLEDVNKKGVYIVRKIYFGNIIELIPYFPYIIASISWAEDKEIIYIAKESYIEEKYKRGIQAGYLPAEEFDQFDHAHRRRLAEITRDIILTYCSDYKERAVQEELPFSKEGKRYVVHPSKKVDGNFEAKVKFPNTGAGAYGESLFTPLDYIDENTLELHPIYSLSNQDKVVVEYVHKKEE